MVEAMLPDSCSRVRTGGLAAVWPPAMPRGSMSGPRRGEARVERSRQVLLTPAESPG